MENNYKKLILGIIITVIIIATIIIIFNINRKDEFKTENNTNTSISAKIDDSKRTMAGKELQKNLYSYRINVGENTFYDFTIKDNYIYYMFSKEGIYQIKRIDLYTAKEEDFAEKELKNYYCEFKDDYIQCYKTGDTNENSPRKLYFDYNFNQIKNFETLKNNQLYVPYKDGLIRIENNKLYFASKEKEEEIKTLKYSSFSINDYCTIDGSTYLILNDTKTAEQYMYDVEKDIYRKFNDKYINNNFNKGLFFVDDKFIETINFSKNIEEQFNNKYNGSISKCAMNDEILSIYDNDDQKIKIYDYMNNKIFEIPYKFEDNFINLHIKNNYLVISKKHELIIFDLSKDLEYKNIEKYNIERNEEINKTIENFQKEYGISVKIKENNKFNVNKLYSEIQTNNSKIIKVLDEFKEIVPKFGKKFFSNFTHNDIKGLELYLTGNIRAEDDIRPVGYAFLNEKNYGILIDITQSDTGKTFYNEIIHAIELNAEYKGLKFEEWEKMNPPEFKYSSVTENYDTTNQKICMDGNNNKKEVYFIDGYSCTSKEEDIAKVFETICIYEKENPIKEYPHLLDKAKYLKKELIDYYPELKDSSIFKSMD